MTIPRDKAAIPFDDIKPGHRVPVPARGSMPAYEHILDEQSIDALRAALVTCRPLLIRGEPGVGKSTLAFAAARALERAFVSHAVDSRTESRDLLWTVDAIARLARAQLMGARRDLNEGVIDIRRFLHPGPIWWAFHWESARAQADLAEGNVPPTPEGWRPEDGVVVLLDEIDKADPSCVTSLLDAFGHGRFDVPGPACVALDPERMPLVVITTNEERALPDAFVRRCWVLHLGLPKKREDLIDELMKRGRAHFKECSDGILRSAAEMLADDRVSAEKMRVTPPGLGEYIEILRAVTKLAMKEPEQRKLLVRLREFAFVKHPEFRA
jgi:MoxR-like ATPase